MKGTLDDMGAGPAVRDGEARRGAAGRPYDAGGAWDEAFDEEGAPRPPYEGLLAHLAEIDLAALAAEVQAAADGQGCVFRTAGGGVDPFRVDPVPRVLTAGEWDLVERAVAQRARALDRFVADVYGARSAVDAGVVPARAIASAHHHEPLLAGLDLGPVPWVTVAGLDLVRDAHGELAVLEDNLRTPSGFAYATGAREAAGARLPQVADVRDPAGAGAAGLLAALHAAAPARGGDEPHVVLLSDGTRNSAWWEHRRLAHRLAIPIVTLGDLEHRGGELVHRAQDGSLTRVDVVYRRTDEDRLTGDDDRLTAVGEALLEPWRRGRVGVANAFGTGVADDKLVHAYVEDLIRFFCHEEPLLPSVPTYDPGDPGTRDDVLARLGELVVKPRWAYGGTGVVIGPHASAEERAEAAAALRDRPDAFVVQDTVTLSTHPTVIDGALRPRHVDLRPFAYSGDGVVVPPGGLTRVAFGDGALIVNSSQNGGAKDTWVMAR